MWKCRVVLERFYVFVEKQGEGSLANLTFHTMKVMKNEVRGTVAPDDVGERSRGNAFKGGNNPWGDPWGLPQGAAQEILRGTPPITSGGPAATPVWSRQGCPMMTCQPKCNW